MPISEVDRQDWQKCIGDERFTSLEAMRRDLVSGPGGHENYHAWECLNCGSWHLETTLTPMIRPH